MSANYSHHNFALPLRVYIEDTDAGGIVYYVNYLKFMERARTELLRSLGYDKTFIFTSERMFVVQQVNCQYHRSARLDDELLATAKPKKVAGSYIDMQQHILRDNELLCEAQVRIVCVDQQTMKPARIPVVLREAVAARN